MTPDRRRKLLALADRLRRIRSELKEIVPKR
jgi:hypothetical protein